MLKKELRYYLLEEYTDSIDLNGGNIVALSPQAAFSLDAQGLNYSILEDYYDEDKLRSGEDKYFSLQLEWIDGLDNIIKDNLEFCRTFNINLLRNIFYLPFKYIVDHTIIETYILRKFIERTRPGEIVYVYNSRKRKHPKNLHQWINEGNNFYKEILSIMALKHGFSISDVDIADKKARNVRTPVKNDNLRRMYLPVKQITKSTYLAVKHNKFSLLLRNKKRNINGLNVLFLHSGCHPHDFLIKDFLQKGANIFVKESSSVFSENRLFRARVLSLDKTDRDKELISKLRSEITKAMPALYTKGRLLDWISGQCSMDIAPILMPFMEHLFGETAVNTIIESGKISDFCKNNKINFVVARAGTDSDSISGLLAANCVKDVKSVCFQHGCYALDFKMLHITEAGMFDIYFASDDLSEKYFKEESPSYIKNRCLVFQEPYIFQNIGKIKKKDNADIAGNILYIPVNHSYFLRCFNNTDYSATWYYKFQKELIDFFATKKSFKFVYKQPPGHRWCIESIIAYIKRKGYKNIIVEKGAISKYLRNAEKVIIDSLSTPLFEVAAFGVPTLAIFKKYVPVWKPAMEHFGKTVQTFDGMQENLDKIEKFLYSNSQDHSVSLPIHANNTYETLLNVKNRNNAW